VQTALHRWFVAVARRRPLLLCTDNLHAADDASTAFLAALGGEARTTHLILMCTLRIGHAIIAPEPVALLTSRCAHLKLAPLDLDACTELVHSLFGEVHSAGRLARLLHDKSAGNPQQYMDLVRLLVSKRIATYAGGTWVLPLEFSADELPSRAEEIFAAKIAELSPAARGFAEALCIHDTPLSLDLCLALSEERDEGAAYAALDELVTKQILVGSGGDYRFAREALREATMSGVATPARLAHHRALRTICRCSCLPLRICCARATTRAARCCWPTRLGALSMPRRSSIRAPSKSCRPCTRPCRGAKRNTARLPSKQNCCCRC
jgi:predicted ATPase